MPQLATLRRSECLRAVREANVITGDEVYESSKVLKVNLEAAHSEAAGYDP